MIPDFLEINGAYYDNVCVLEVGDIVVIEASFYRVSQISLDEAHDLVAYCNPL